jgi:hypothetical protein
MMKIKINIIVMAVASAVLVDVTNSSTVSAAICAFPINYRIDIR